MKIKCANCETEINKEVEFCPYCGKRNPEKFNRIYLDEPHYRNLRDNPDYYKCESCGSVNHITFARCQNCSAPNKELPKKKVEKEKKQIFNFFLSPKDQEEKAEEKEKAITVKKKKPIAATIWGKLPQVVKLFVIGALLLGLGSITYPLNLIDGLLSGGLSLSGIGIIILAFGSLKSKDTKKEKK